MVKPSRCIKASFRMYKEKLDFLKSRGFAMTIVVDLFDNNDIFCYFATLSKSFLFTTIRDL